MINLLIFSVSFLIQLTTPEPCLPFNELKKRIEIKKEEFILNLPQNIKNKIKIKKELILSQKILVEIDDSSFSLLQKFNLPYTKDYLIPLPKLKESQENLGFWHKKFIEADTFYKIGLKGKGIIIAVLDTGCDTSHPEIKGKIILFKDFVNYGGIDDPIGHGTFVSSLIAGDSAGVAPDARLIILKVFSEEGGKFSDIHEAFDYIAELIENGVGIKIINGSFGTYPYVSEFFPDIEYLKKRGVFICFAAGNEGPSSGTVSAPGNYPFVFSTGACDFYSNIPSFSSRGPSPFKYPWSDSSKWFFNDWNFISPFLITPGKSIKGAYLQNTYIIGDGTSASSPILAGSIALILNYNPFITPDSLALIFKNHLFKKSEINYPNYSEGFGFLKLKNIIKHIERKDTLFFTVSNFEINSKTSEIFTGDSFIVNISLISNKKLNDTVKVKLTGSRNIILIDTLFTFLPDSPVIIKSKALMIDERADSLKINLFLNYKNYSKYFSLRKKIRGDTLITFKNKDYEFSVSATGSIGFSTSEQIRGKGLVYKNFGNLLYYGSIAFGNSINYIVDRFYETMRIDDRDTKPLKFNNSFFAKEKDFIKFRFSDNYVQYPKGNILEVKIKDLNEGFLFILKPVYFLPETTYLSLFLDPDIEDALFNFASYDSTTNILYTYYKGGPFLGILSFNKENICGVIDNPFYAYPYGGLPDSIQFMFMSGKIKSIENIKYTDYSIFISKKIYPPDSLYFVIFAGESLDTLFSKREKIIKKLQTKPENEFKGISKIWPNPFISPFHNEIKILLKGKGELDLFDISGRKIYTLFNSNETASILKLKSLRKSGVYFIKFENQKKFYKLIYLDLK